MKVLGLTKCRELMIVVRSVLEKVGDVWSDEISGLDDTMDGYRDDEERSSLD